jgi:mannose-6-phosphate isomerase-like protein (cupin superfamily)
METVLDILGNWPPEIQEARRKRQHLHIPAEKALTLVHGNANPTKVTFFISYDKCHVGTMDLFPGRHSDPETHLGDEVFMVLKGSVQLIILNELEDEKAVSRKAHEVQEGQKFLIPEGYAHQYCNLGAGLSRILFTIAPGL